GGSRALSFSFLSASSAVPAHAAPNTPRATTSLSPAGGDRERTSEGGKRDVSSRPVCVCVCVCVCVITLTLVDSVSTAYESYTKTTREGEREEEGERGKERERWRDR